MGKLLPRQRGHVTIIWPRSFWRPLTIFQELAVSKVTPALITTARYLGSLVCLGDGRARSSSRCPSFLCVGVQRQCDGSAAPARSRCTSGGAATPDTDTRTQRTSMIKGAFSCTHTHIYIYIYTHNHPSWAYPYLIMDSVNPNKYVNVLC